MNEQYLKELKEFAQFANHKARRKEKYSYKRKISSIAKKYNKTFDEVFTDWINLRLGW
jgi:hypothetical protein